MPLLLMQWPLCMKASAERRELKLFPLMRRQLAHSICLPRITGSRLLCLYFLCLLLGMNFT